MAWWNITGHFSYTGDPASSDRDNIRWLIGDTDAEEPLVGNEEIDAAIAEEGTVYGAAARCAGAIAARFARLVTKSVDGNVNHALSDLWKHYRELAADMTSKASTEVGGGLGVDGGIYCGGISVADKLAQEENTDRVTPAFRTGMWDNLG